MAHTSSASLQSANRRRERINSYYNLGEAQHVLWSEAAVNSRRACCSLSSAACNKKQTIVASLSQVAGLMYGRGRLYCDRHAVTGVCWTASSSHTGNIPTNSLKCVNTTRIGSNWLETIHQNWTCAFVYISMHITALLMYILMWINTI